MRKTVIWTVFLVVWVLTAVFFSLFITVVTEGTLVRFLLCVFAGAVSWEFACAARDTVRMKWKD